MIPGDKAKLTIVRGAGQGASFPVSAPETSLGRNRGEVDIILGDSGVSRVHCRIVHDGQDYFAEDLGSFNGTYIGQQQIKREKLNDGDIITVGQTFLEFRTTSGPSKAETHTSDEPEILAEIDQTEVGTLYSPEHLAKGDSDELSGNMARVFNLVRSVEGCGSETEFWQRLHNALGDLLPGACLCLYSLESPKHLALDWSSASSGTRPITSGTVAAQVLETRRGLLYRDVAKQAEVTDSMQSLGIQSVACAPICSAGRVYGILEAASAASAPPLSREDLELISVAANFIGLALESVRQLDATQRANAVMREQLGERYPLIGASPKINAVLEQIDRLAKVDSTVLILGETGTGKEVAARAIHDKSARSNGPLVPVNCAAIPETLIESEFFGHEKGAFTGALATKRGKFELAQGGTIFLDEIGDLGLDLQARLLRVLEDHEVVRIGSEGPRKIDVRVLAATNKALSTLADEGQFRKDLYYRLSVVSLQLPAMREHMQDLEAIAEFFLRQFAGEIGGPARSFSAKAMEKMANHRWPGNVRELKNVIERAVVFAGGPEIKAEDIVLGHPQASALSDAGNLLVSLEDMEKRHIESVLEAVSGNRTRAAEILGISRSGLIRKIKGYGLPQ